MPIKGINQQVNNPIIIGGTIDDCIIGGTTPAAGAFTTLNATTEIQLNGTNINTGGTLTNVAYLDQANIFTDTQKIQNNDLLIDTTGTNVDSPLIRIYANDDGTKIEGTIQVLRNTDNPYIQFSVDDDGTTPSLTSSLQIYSEIVLSLNDLAAINSGGNPKVIVGDDLSSAFGYIQWDSTNDYIKLETDANGIKVKGNDVSIGNIFPSQPLIVGEGSTELFRVQDNGNVGVGTDSPDNRLHIQESNASATSNANAQVTIEKNADVGLQFLSPNSNNQRILFGDPESSAVGRIEYAHDADLLSLYVNGTSQLIIDSDGNVGINQSTTAAKLHEIGRAHV